MKYHTGADPQPAARIPGEAPVNHAATKMTISNLLVVSDAFRVGGRETFISSHLSELKKRHGTNTSLLAGQVADHSPSGVFNTLSVADGVGLEQIRNYLKEGEKLIDVSRPDLIWAHHYMLLPAWLLAVRHQIPLLVTFHGVVTGPGSAGTRLEALGMTLALDRMTFVTAVSHEITKSLESSAGRGLDVGFLPNRVCPVSGTNAPGQNTTRFIMLTRVEKIDHMRAGVSFLTKWLSVIGDAKLTICVGLRDEHAQYESWSGNRLGAKAKRLGRRWLLNHPRYLNALIKTEFELSPSNPSKMIAENNVVIGMGRTVLEGMIAQKPAVLIGYENVVDLVSAANFSALQESNFSGRGVTPNSIDRIVKNTAGALAGHNPIPEEILSAIDIEKSWTEIDIVLKKALQTCTPNGSSDVELAAAAIRILEESDTEQSFFHEIGCHLTCLQNAIFEKLQ